MGGPSGSAELPHLQITQGPLPFRRAGDSMARLLLSVVLHHAVSNELFGIADLPVAQHL
jgi:hypothetical protein